MEKILIFYFLKHNDSIHIATNHPNFMNYNKKYHCDLIFFFSVSCLEKKSTFWSQFMTPVWQKMRD